MICLSFTGHYFCTDKVLALKAVNKLEGEAVSILKRFKIFRLAERSGINRFKLFLNDDQKNDGLKYEFLERIACGKSSLSIFSQFTFSVDV